MAYADAAVLGVLVDARQAPFEPVLQETTGVGLVGAAKAAGVHPGTGAGAPGVEAGPVPFVRQDLAKHQAATVGAAHGPTVTGTGVAPGRAEGQEMHPGGPEARVLVMGRWRRALVVATRQLARRRAPVGVGPTLALKRVERVGPRGAPRQLQGRALPRAVRG